MKLTALTRENLEQVRLWRNDSLVALRTPYMLTKEQQEDFYDKVVCNRDARARFWGVIGEIKTFGGLGGISPTGIDTDYVFIGMVGLENIEYENRRAEISIIINPEYQGKGYGEQAVELLLEQGFMYLNLENIWGEVYCCNDAKIFWKKQLYKYNGSCVILLNTKYWSGEYHDSLWFNITKEEWTACHK